MGALRNIEINKIVAAHAQAVFDSYTQERRAINAERDAESIKEKCALLQRQNDTIRQMYKQQSADLSKSRKRTLRLASNVISKGTHINSLTHSRDRALRDAYVQSQLLKQCQLDLEFALTQIEREGSELESGLPDASYKVLVPEEGKELSARDRVKQLQLQFESYRKGIASLQKENDTLIKKIESLTTDCDRLASAHAESEKTIADLSKQKKDADDRLHEIKCQLTAFEGSFQEHQRAHEIAEAGWSHNNADLQNQLAQARSQLEVAVVNHESIVQHLQSQIQQAIQEKSNSLDQIQHLELNIAQIRDAQQAQIQESQRAIEEANNGQRRLEQELSEVKQKLEAAHQSAERTELEHKDQIDELKGKITISQDEIGIFRARIQSINEDHERERSEFRFRESDLIQRCSSLQEEAERVREQAASLALHATQNENQLSCSVNQLKDVILTLEESKSTVNSERQSLLEQQQQMKATLTDLESRLLQASQRENDLISQRERLDTQISILESDTERNAQIQRDLEFQIGQYRTEQGVLNQSIESLQTELRASQNETALAKERERTILAQLEELTSTLELTRSRMNDYQAKTRKDLGDALGKQSSLQSEFERGQKAYETLQRQHAQKVETLETEISSKLAQLKAESTSKHKLRTEKEQLSVELQARQDILLKVRSDYSRAIETLEREQADHGVAKQKLMLTIDELTEKTHGLEDDVIKKTGELIEVNDYLKSQLAYGQELMSKIEPLRAELEERDNNLEQTKARLQKVLESANKEAKNYNERISFLASENADLRKQKESLLQELAQSSNEYNSKKAELDDAVQNLQSTLASKEAELLQKQTEFDLAISQARTEVEEEKQRLSEESQAHLAEAEKNMLELRASLESQTNELRAAKLELEQTIEHQAEELRVSYSRIEGAGAQHASQLKELQDQLESTSELSQQEHKLLTDRIEKLRQTVATLETEKQSIESSLAEARIVFENASREATSSIEKIRKEKVALESQVTELKWQVNNSRLESTSIREEFDEYYIRNSAQIRRLEADLVAANHAREEEVSTLQGEMEKLVVTSEMNAENATAKISRLETAGTALQEEIKMKDSEIEMLRREIGSKLESSLRQLEISSTEKAQVESMLASLQLQLDEALSSREKSESLARANQGDLEAELAASQSRIDSLTKLVSQFQGTATDNETRVGSLSKIVSELEGQLKQNGSELEKSHSQINSLETRNKELEVRATSSDEAANGFRGLITVLQDHVSFLECQLESVKTEVISERLLKAHTQEKFEGSLSKIQELEDQILRGNEKLEERLALAKNRSCMLEKQLHESDQIAQESQQRLDNAERRLAAALENITGLERLLESSERSLDSVGNITARCGMQFDQYIQHSESQFSEQKKSLDKARTEVSTLQSANSVLSREREQLLKKITELEGLNCPPQAASTKLQDHHLIATPPPSSPSACSLVIERDFQSMSLDPQTPVTRRGTTSRISRFSTASVSRKWRNSLPLAPRSPDEMDESSPPMTSNEDGSAARAGAKSPGPQLSSSRRSQFLGWRPSRKMVSLRTPPQSAAAEGMTALGSPMHSKVVKPPSSSHSTSSMRFPWKKSPELTIDTKENMETVEGPSPATPKTADKRNKLLPKIFT